MAALWNNVRDSFKMFPESLYFWETQNSKFV